ncbi:MAG: TIGR02996 domain-containing protein [Gemmataceae bacterium]
MNPSVPQNNTQQSLLQAIRESPLDENLRLVYADWLEEQGDSPQAELIRLQCEMDRLDEDTAQFAAFEKRTKSLLKKHKKEWFGTPPKKLQASYHRGTLEVTLSAQSMVADDVRQWWSNYGHLVIDLDGHKLTHSNFLRDLRETRWLDGVTKFDGWTFWDGDEAAELLSELSWLRSVVICAEALSPEGFHKFHKLKLLQHLTLETFYPRALDYFDEELDTIFSDEDFEMLGQFQHLCSLFLSDCDFEDSNTMSVLTKLPHLRNLELETECSKKTMEIISNITSLERLVIDPVEFAGSWIKSLSALPKLVELECRGAVGGSTATKHLHKLKRLRKLTIEDAGSRQLSSLKLGTSVEHLHLFVGFEEPACYPLKDLPELPHLKGLNVSGNDVKSTDLPEITKFPELRSLVLSHTSISGNALKHLDGLEHLEDLAIDGMNIQDTAIKHLANMSSLRYLSLRNTKITKEGFRQLRKERPDVTIVDK